MTATETHDASCLCGCIDDFEPVAGPSLASVHRQWLDRGLPASTWPTYLAQWQANQTPVKTAPNPPGGGAVSVVVTTEYRPETKGNALSGVRCSIVPGSGNYHFDLAGCDDCNVRDLVSRSLEYVEDRYRTGYVGQAMFEAFMHVWATSAVRYSNYATWVAEPFDPEVVALVKLFRLVTGSYPARCVASKHIPTTGAECSVCGAAGMQHEDDHPGGGAR